MITTRNVTFDESLFYQGEINEISREETLKIVEILLENEILDPELMELEPVWSEQQKRIVEI